ncbi:hypothetical protein TWF970_002439, partial [Orbilia oligospora]
MSAERKRQFIGQFLEYYEDFGVLICTVHRGAIIPSNVARHVNDQHRSVSLDLRKELIKQCEGLRLTSPAEIKAAGSPIEAFDCLEEPRKIFVCAVDDCRISYLGEGQITKHINQTHDIRGTRWQPIRDRWKQTIGQTFFRKKNHTNYFEVYAGTGAGNDVGQVIETDPTAFDRFLSDLKVRSKDVEGLVHSSEITPWMKRSGFWDHMIGFDLKTIQEAMLLPKDYKLRGTGSEGSELEGQLGIICGGVDRVLRRGVAFASNSNGSNVQSLLPRLARVLNTFRSDQANVEPFGRLQESATLKKYISTWQRLVCYFFRASSIEREDDGRQLFTVTDEQTAARDRVFRALSGNPSTGEFDTDDDEIYRELDDSIAEMCMSFVAHLILSNVFESVMLSFCAALCIGRTGESGMLEPAMFSSLQSQIIYCAQLTILVWSRRKAEVGSAAPGDVDEQMFADILTKNCKRWLVNDTEGPLGEILSQRLYTMAAGRSQGMPAEITWSEDGSTVTYQSSRLRLEDLRKFARSQYDIAEEILRKELLFSAETPSFETPELFDNWGSRKIGYSFLDSKESGELLRRNLAGNWLLTGDNALKSGFQKTSKASGIKVWQPSKLKAYESSVRRFLKHLLVLIHISAGQPGRRKEILGTKFVNTKKNLRNVLIYN